VNPSCPIYTPTAPANYVIEAKAGFVAANGISVGTAIQLTSVSASGVPSAFVVNGKTYAFTYTATTQSEREAGLMDKPVTNATSMLFVFDSFGRWQFWMYNTHTSLDMIWINATAGTGHVVYLVTSAPPCNA
jgi:uncharacterized membrane protein (UPF0127 family)